MNRGDPDGAESGEAAGAPGAARCVLGAAGSGFACASRGRGWSCRVVLVALLWLLSPESVNAQKPWHWRVYKMSDGLPEAGCVSVTVAPQGKVLVRHLTLPFVSELDGYAVTNYPAPLVGKSRIYESPGHQLWAVASEGLQEFTGSSWLVHPVPEIASEPRASAWVIDPVPLCPVRQGLVIFLLADRLMQYGGEDAAGRRSTVLLAAGRTRLGNFTGLATARDGGLWLSGQRGVAKSPGSFRNLKPETVWIEYVPPPELHIGGFLAPHEDENGGLTVVAESLTNQQKMVAYLDPQGGWTASAPGQERLRQTWRGPDDSCWGMTTLALYRGEVGKGVLSETDEITPRQFFDVALERSGAFWLATSDGLFRYAPLLWRTPGPLRKFSAAVQCVAVDLEGRLWYASGNQLYMLGEHGYEAYTFGAPGSRNLQGRALFLLKDGSFVLEAEDSESATLIPPLRFRPDRGAFSPLVPPEANRQLKVLGQLKDGSLCLQNLKYHAADSGGSLERFDGRRFETLASPPPLGTNLLAFFAAQNGDWWLGGDLATACYRDNKWRSYSSADQSGPAGALCFVELADGRIWCATPSQVWEFDGRNWSVVRGGFDHINAMVRTRDRVWIAANSGLYHCFQGTWIENGVEDGLAGSAVRALCEDQKGRLWAATSHGLSLYRPEADPDAPQTSIVPSSDNFRNLPEGASLSFAFLGQDRWRYTARERLLYSFRLDEHDWSAFRETSQISFSDLPAGQHHLQVRAMDRNGNVEGPKPAQFDFSVVQPWYKEGRLVLISIGGLALVVFFAGLAFNRHLQLMRSYAAVELKVAERTRELEIANRELLHSQKMTALGTLAAGIAHDFNNILSIIQGSAQIIEDNLDNPQKIRTRTERIRTVVEQGAGIVKAMLGFSRDSGSEPAVCESDAVVQETLKLLGDRFLREVQVTYQSDGTLPPIVASKDFIQQILLNFIFNAAESMTKDKRIRLGTRLLSKLPPALVLAPAPAPAYVAIAVQDFGCGISAENLPRIFEPFFTTKALSARRGTGLGLSMAYELAKRMGAGLAVDSVVNQGSTFTLILPVQPNSEAPQATS